jgi:Flp pilus assembly protein TadD
MKILPGFISVRFVTLLLLALGVLWGENADPLANAADLYRRTDYQASLALLRQSGQESAKADILAGKDQFMLGEYKKAAEALERALALEPASAECALWLGRSYGRRAETASPFTAPKYASKARTYFEKAVMLDPRNPDALSDLFDYYLQAPGFLGGGYDKAERIAQQLAAADPAQGDVAQAKLAERRREFDTAEEQLRRAIQEAPRQVGRLLDLARYLANRGQVAESDATFDRAEQLAPGSPKVAFSRAQVYVQQRRNLDKARALLNRYLQSQLTPDDPSRAQAKKLLKEASGA